MKGHSMLSKLRYFVVVADCLNFTQAAKRLFISQSTVSAQIASLEQELGCELFTRNRRVVRLTPAGEDFLKTARALLTGYESGLERLAEFRDRERKTVSFGIDFALGGQITTQLFRYLHEKFTTVDFKTYEMQYHEILLALERHEIEIGFPFMATGSFKSEHFKSRLIGYDSISLLLPSSHPLASARELNDLAALTGEKCFGIAHQQKGKDYDAVMGEFLKQRGLTLGTIEYVDEFSSLELMVAAGFGISIAPTSMTKTRKKGIKYHQIEGTERLLRDYLIWNDTLQRPEVSAIATAIVDFMKDWQAPVERDRN
jgi:DNA-binding transcriptional LysR family regulator